MGLFFGTDGIRGIVGEDITSDLAIKCGKAIAKLKPNCKIVLARDTRPSGQMIANSFALGATLCGATVIDIGIASTPCVSYLVCKGYDYGVVISASHNPAEYNGIKVFDNTGKKISDKTEQYIEKLLVSALPENIDNLGKVLHINLVNNYINFLISIGTNLKGKKIVLDCANGASIPIAKRVYKKLGARVICIGANLNKPINYHCGATYPQKLSENVKKYKADFGFAFDGDADRIIVCDGSGKIYNGDNILLAISKYYDGGTRVVGTSMSNLGLELSLGKLGKSLVRADVGDKYVSDKMTKLNISVGGEQSGHIILKNLLPTGDGVLVSLVLCNIAQSTGKTMAQLLEMQNFPQVIKNVLVQDKLRIMGSEILASSITYANQELAGNGRVLVRPSGTEQKIRVMVEAFNEEDAVRIANYLTDVIENIKEDILCAE